MDSGQRSCHRDTTKTRQRILIYCRAYASVYRATGTECAGIQPRAMGTAVRNSHSNSHLQIATPMAIAIYAFISTFSRFFRSAGCFSGRAKRFCLQTKDSQLGFRQVYDFHQLQGRDARHVQDANLCICSCERAKV